MPGRHAGMGSAKKQLTAKTFISQLLSHTQSVINLHTHCSEADNIIVVNR